MQDCGTDLTTAQLKAVLVGCCPKWADVVTYQVVASVMRRSLLAGVKTAVC